MNEIFMRKIIMGLEIRGAQSHRVRSEIVSSEIVSTDGRAMVEKTCRPVNATRAARFQVCVWRVVEA